MGEAVQYMHKLKAQLGEEKYSNAQKLILRLTKSITENPQDEKKRSIKLDKFKEKVQGSEACVTVMFKLGFEERSGSLVFPESGSIPKLKDFQAAMEGGYPGAMSGAGSGMSTWPGAGSQYGGMGSGGTGTTGTGGKGTITTGSYDPATGTYTPGTGTYTPGATGGTTGTGQYGSGGQYSGGMGSYGGGMSAYGGGMSSFGGGMSSFGGGLSSYDGLSSFGGMSSFGGGFGSGRGPTPLRGGMGDLGKYAGMGLGTSGISSKQPPLTSQSTTTTTSTTAATTSASLSGTETSPLGSGGIQQSSSASPLSSGSMPRFESTGTGQTPAAASTPPAMNQTGTLASQPQMFGQQTRADDGPGKDSYNSADPLTVGAHLASHFFTSWVQVSSTPAGGDRAQLSETIAASQMVVEKAAKRLGIMEDGSELDRAWRSVKEGMQSAARGAATDALRDVWISVNNCFKIMVEAMRAKCPPECVNMAIFLFSSVAVISTMSSGQGVNSDLLQQFVEIAVDLPDRFDEEYSESVAKANELVIKAMTDGTLTGEDVTQLTDRLLWQVNDFLAHFKSYPEPPPGSGLPRLPGGVSGGPSSAFTPGVSSGAGPPTAGFSPSVAPIGVPTPQPVPSSPAVSAASAAEGAPTRTPPLPSVLTRPPPPLSEVLAGIRENMARTPATTGSATDTTSSGEGMMSGGFSHSGGMLRMDGFGGTGLREDRMGVGGFSNGFGYSGTTGQMTEKADEEATKESDDKDQESEKAMKTVPTGAVETSTSGTGIGSKVTPDSASSKEPAEQGDSSQRVRVPIQHDSDEETTEQQAEVEKVVSLPEEGEEMTAEEYKALVDSLPLEEAAKLIIQVSNDLEKMWNEDVDEVSGLLITKEGVAANVQKRLESRKVKLEEELELINENRQQAQEFLEFRAGRIETWPVRPLKRPPDEEDQMDGAIPLQKVDPDVLQDILQRVANPVGQDTATSDRAKELLQSWYILLPEFSDEAIVSLAKDLEIDTEGKTRPALLEMITQVWSLQGFHKASASTSDTHQEQATPPSLMSSEEIATASVASAEQRVEKESTGEKERRDLDEKEADESEKE